MERDDDMVTAINDTLMTMRVYGINEKNCVPILGALRAIAERSDGRYNPEAELAVIQSWLRQQPEETLALLVLDIEPGSEHKYGLCGVFVTRLGNNGVEKIAMIEVGWTPPERRSVACEAALHVIEQWARERGVNRIRMCSAHRARAGGEYAHEHGALAVERWIKQFGFERKETIFEKQLSGENGTKS